MANNTTILTVRLATRTGPLDVPVLHMAGQLAITPTVSVSHGLRWDCVAITHVPSGLAVCPYLDLAEARALLPALAALDGWDGEITSNIGKNIALRNAVRDAVRRIMSEEE